MTKYLYKKITIQNPFIPAYQADVLIEDNIICDISENIIANADETINATDKIIMPGMIDRHTHGGYGCNFNTCNEEELQNYLVNVKKHGIIGVLPTIMTDSIDNINEQINLLKATKSKGAKILGIHLEGPFINPTKKGIHPEKYILEPTIENLDKINTDFIKVITYAPELDHNGEFLAELQKRNVIPSVGHSDCTYDLAEKVFENGATQITHIFNAIRGIHHREPSVITAALNNDNVFIELIADLEHVHKAIIELLLKSKPKDKILLISDSLPISYSNDKEGIFGGQKIYYDGQKATSKDGVLAGSTLFLDDIYNRIKDFVPFENFVGYTTSNIAKSLNLEDNYCEIKIGSKDNFIIRDKF